MGPDGRRGTRIDRERKRRGGKDGTKGNDLALLFIVFCPPLELSSKVLLLRRMWDILNEIQIKNKKLLK